MNFLSRERIAFLVKNLGLFISMRFIYTVSVFSYQIIILIASLFNKKASLRVKGVKQTFSRLKSFEPYDSVWIHCASLGEFEQGRPLIEKLKQRQPETKIVLSFFSPSGYEIRNSYEHADLVIYLPHDSKRNANRLIDLIKPKAVFFIKYEFWYHYIKAIHKRNIPLYLVSGIFRKDQVFFKPHGSFFREMLRMFTFLFVQNNDSKQLLESIGIKTISVTGDTRFDRVYEISKNRKNFELIEAFKGEHLLMVAGSTWKPDEEIIFRYISKSDTTSKFIIVPHEIDPSNIERIVRLSDKVTVKYSEADQTTAKNADVMIIDNIGMLSSLYAYADIAYIGGGFGKGIHNTLEAAVYGIPIIFGPRYEKFDEAKELIQRGAAFTIGEEEDFSLIMQKLLSDQEYRKNTGEHALRYVNENVGATEKTLNNYEL